MGIWLLFGTGCDGHHGCGDANLFPEKEVDLILKLYRIPGPGEIFFQIKNICELADYLDVPRTTDTVAGM